jgi:hypothetical protein
MPMPSAVPAPIPDRLLSNITAHPPHQPAGVVSDVDDPRAIGPDRDCAEFVAATLGYHIAGAITEAVAFVAADDGHVALLDDGAARLTDNRAVAFADLPAL